MVENVKKKEELKSLSDVEENSSIKKENNTNYNQTQELMSRNNSNQEEASSVSESEESSKLLTSDQLKRLLSRFKSKLPSAIINELYNSLSSMDLTEDEALSIINEVYAKYTGGSREELEEIMLKIQKNDIMLRNISEKLEKLLDVISKGKEEKEEENIEYEKDSKNVESKSNEKNNINNALIIEPSKEELSSQTTLKSYQLGLSINKQFAQMNDDVQKTGIQAQERLQEPLLTYIKKDPFSMAVLMRWIEFMLKKVGNEKLSDLLDYYLDIGWISEEVVLQVLTYAKGMEVHVEKGARKRLTPEDHFKTLLFIEKMRGTPIDRLTLTKMERELSLLTKKSEDYDDVYGI
ncbi:MAG: FlaD/FlaE family flagellar protein [Candidatus Anstonellales archaeon]